MEVLQETVRHPSGIHGPHAPTDASKIMIVRIT
jgi:hypothetical protein